MDEIFGTEGWLMIINDLYWKPHPQNFDNFILIKILKNTFFPTFQMRLIELSSIQSSKRSFAKNCVESASKIWPAREGRGNFF